LKLVEEEFEFWYLFELEFETVKMQRDSDGVAWWWCYDGVSRWFEVWGLSLNFTVGLSFTVTDIHIVFVTFVIIFKFILIYLLHVLLVFKIKGIFGKMW